MSDTGANPPSDKPPGFDSGFISGEFRQPQQLSARVPESVARGVFSTGVVVLSNPSEFVLDFLLRMSRPHQLVARVVLPTAVVPSVTNAIADNVRKFTERYGPIPALPKPDDSRKPTIQEIYDDLKLSDEILCGAYANGIMVGHSPAEFCFDFFTNFFPRTSVSTRVYLSAPHVPRLVDSLTQTYNDMQKKLANRPPQPPPEGGSAEQPPKDG